MAVQGRGVQPRRSADAVMGVDPTGLIYRLREMYVDQGLSTYPIAAEPGIDRQRVTACCDALVSSSPTVVPAGLGPRGG